MKATSTKADVGILIGRFQVDNLHQSHIELIDFVQSNHSRTIIFLGYSPIPCTQNNPLPWRARKQMILEKYPNVDVLFIKDVNNDEVWSKKLDEYIEDLIGHKSAVLYGGRDSFIPHYHGKYPTCELMMEQYCSGTDIRQNIGNNTISSSDFRAGVIFATQNQYPTSIPTVDIAIIKHVNYQEGYASDNNWVEYDAVLLVRKPNEEKWRFPGGFVKPGETWEQAVKREGYEETDLEFDDLKYIGSYSIDDWRYSKEINKITTSFFKAKYIFGSEKGQDDVKEAKWFDLKKLNENYFVEEHKILFKTLINNL
jgi:bifunctional NMN adenylyltransferase/nudix hydrolase